MTHEFPDDHDHLVYAVYNWDDRKKQFSIRQITLAADVLKGKGWIGTGGSTGRRHETADQRR